MRRDPFDEVCACEYDEPSRHRICTKRKEQAKGLCPPCQAGRHTLKRKGERISETEALAALGGRRRQI